MEQLKTNWENIGLSNDFLFGKIMRKPALCKRMLEIILGVKIDRLEYLESQKSIDEEWDARSKPAAFVLPLFQIYFVPCSPV